MFVKTRKKHLFEARRRRILGAAMMIRDGLSIEERRRVYVFGSWVWGWPHERSDLDVAIDDRYMDAGESLKFLKKVLPEGYEDDIDILYITEAPGYLRRKILNEGVGIDEAVERLKSGRFFRAE